MALLFAPSWSLASVLVKSNGSPEYEEPKADLEAAFPAASISGKEVIITVGPEALASQLSSTEDRSLVIATMITSASFRDVLQQFPHRSTANVSAIYADPSPAKLVALTKALLKNSKILIAQSTQSKTVLQEDDRWKSAGVEVLAVAPGDTRSILSRMDRFDILISIPDTTLYNSSTMQPIVSSLYRRQKFVIGYSRGMTTSGALASIATDRTHVIAELRKAAAILEDTGALPPPTFPSEYSLHINKVLARSIGMHDIDESVVRKNLSSNLERTDD